MRFRSSVCRYRAGGANQPEVEQMRMSALAEVLNLAAAGAEPGHRVDVERGY